MKKYIYLILATVIIIPSIIMSGYALKGSSVNVETLVLELQDMDNTVTSSGKLQYRSGKTIKCDGFGIMKEVYVKSGDVIKKGDRLFSYYQADMAEQYADMGNILGNAFTYTPEGGSVSDRGSKEILYGERSRFGNRGKNNICSVQCR